jgi:hypothetical protein
MTKKLPPSKSSKSNKRINGNDDDDHTEVDDTSDVQGINILTDYVSLPVIGATSGKKVLKRKEL